MTPAAQWKRLCKEWRAAQRAANRFPLFDRGQMRLDRLDEWKRLNDDLSSMALGAR